MFQSCEDLASLNERRRNLISKNPGDAASINAAYNKAKSELMSRRPTFRRPPSFTSAMPETLKGFVPYKLVLGEVPKNTLVLCGTTVMM